MPRVVGCLCLWAACRGTQGCVCIGLGQHPVCARTGLGPSESRHSPWNEFLLLVLPASMGPPMLGSFPPTLTFILGSA